MSRGGAGLETFREQHLTAAAGRAVAQRAASELLEAVAVVDGAAVGIGGGC